MLSLEPPPDSRLPARRTLRVRGHTVGRAAALFAAPIKAGAHIRVLVSGATATLTVVSAIFVRVTVTFVVLRVTVSFVILVEVKLAPSSSIRLLFVVFVFRG